MRQNGVYHDARELRRMLEGTAETAAAHLLPNGIKRGKEWCVGSIAGEAGESLKVAIKGAKVGLWAEFAGGTGGGPAESGDLFDLWMRVKGITFVQMLDEVRAFLGVPQPPSFTHSHDGRPRSHFRKPTRPAGTSRPQEGTPGFVYLRGRGLADETIRLYKIGERDCDMAVAEKNPELGIHGRELIFPFLSPNDELVFVKHLALRRTPHQDPSKPDKKITHVAPGCEPILFGWQAMTDNDRSVVICEGEINAMSWREFGVAALATPYGAGTGHKHDWVDSMYDALQRFEWIFLNFDPDVAGKGAIDALVERLGRHRCKVIPAWDPALGKDANDLLAGHMAKSEAKEILDKAATIDPPKLVNASTYKDRIREFLRPTGGQHPGFDLPFPSFVNKLRIRRKELVIWTGHPGHGKTRILTYILNYAADGGERVCVASFEEPPEMYLGRAWQQLTHDPAPNDELLDLCAEWSRERVWIFDLVGNARRDELLQVFEYARRRYNIRQFVIDSLVRCGFDEEDYSGQKNFVDKLCEFVQIHDSTMHLVAHPRKDTRTGTDKLYTPGMYDVAGGKALSGVCQVGMTIYRDEPLEAKIAALDDEADRIMGHNPAGAAVFNQQANDLYNDSGVLLQTWKQRIGGKKPKALLLFNDQTGVYHEKGTNPVPIIRTSGYVMPAPPPEPVEFDPPPIPPEGSIRELAFEDARFGDYEELTDELLSPEIKPKLPADELDFGGDDE